MLTQFNVGEEQKAYVCDVRSVQEDLAVLKQKAEDVVGQSVLSNMRVQAELYYSNMNSYGPTVSSCSAGIFAEKNAVGGLGDAMSNLGTVATELSCVAGGTMNQQGSQSWRVSARLQSSKYWCSDSTGNMTEVSATIPTYQLTCK